MNLDDKIKHATALLRYFPEPRALMCSFGKDSIALLHLAREVLPPNPMLAHQYPVPVIHFRNPWFPAKYEFADSITRSWGLEVHDCLPINAGVKTKEDMIELVARYQFGTGAIDLPINTLPPSPRKDFACGLQWVYRPRQSSSTWNIKTVFIGHKSSDVDQFEGHVPLKHDAAKVGEVNMVFPLRHWTDDDIWEYIETNHVPYDKRRYAGRMEVPDKWLNPDYINACTNCCDPRNKEKMVLCPKLNKQVENVGGQIPVLSERPKYIEEEKHVSMGSV
jgi:3'-phosphoadenosine 5'-phosphosulfate sulfotransferase (PAPS reductase)/FAD synthetase